MKIKATDIQIFHFTFNIFVILAITIIANTKVFAASANEYINKVDGKYQNEERYTPEAKTSLQHTISNVSIGEQVFESAEYDDVSKINTVSVKEAVYKTLQYNNSKDYLNSLELTASNDRIGVRDLARILELSDTISWWVEKNGKFKVKIEPKMKNAAIQLTRSGKEIKIKAYVNFMGENATKENIDLVKKGLYMWEKDSTIGGEVLKSTLLIKRAVSTDEKGNMYFKMGLDTRLHGAFNINMTRVEQNHIAGYSHVDITENDWRIENTTGEMHLQFNNPIESIANAAHEFGHLLGINDESSYNEDGSDDLSRRLAPQYNLDGSIYFVPGGDQNEKKEDILYRANKEEWKKFTFINKSSDIMRFGGGFSGAIVSDYDVLRAMKAFENNKMQFEVGTPINYELED